MSQKEGPWSCVVKVRFVDDATLQPLQVGDAITSVDEVGARVIKVCCCVMEQQPCLTSLAGAARSAHVVAHASG
jgi:hypothetical protein